MDIDKYNVIDVNREFVEVYDEFFTEILEDENVYVDKTELLSLLNKQLGKSDKFICVSRPRRFGKTLTASMICSYYSIGQNSHELFKNLKIAKDPSYKEHLNKYHTIFINIANVFSDAENNVKVMLEYLNKQIVQDLKDFYSSIELDEKKPLRVNLRKFYKLTGTPFIIIIDEWDAVLKIKQNNEEDTITYLEWFRKNLKNQKYVALAYMTGVLPIKKYGTRSGINMFNEYSMLEPKQFTPYIGFTDDEVRELCTKFNVSFSDMKAWYDGYQFNDIHIYNPNSVVSSIKGGAFYSYWGKTASFEDIKEYISLNLNGLKDKVIKLAAGECIECNTSGFTNDMTNLAETDNVLTLLIHLGYLSIRGQHHGGEKYNVVVPNKEIKQQFIDNFEHSKAYNYVYEIIENCNNLLDSIWSKDEKTVAEALQYCHNKYASIFTYNNENTLATVIILSLFFSSEYYIFKREAVAGKGFADMVYIPRKGKNVPALLMELKYNKSAKTAIDQIKDRQYIDFFDDYKGKVLLVGINYNDKKEHECKIEEVTL